MGFLRLLHSAGSVLACCTLLLLAACDLQGESDETASRDGTGPAKIKPELVLQIGHARPVEAVAWTPEGSRIITLGDDGSIVMWDIATKTILVHAHVPIDWHEAGLATDEGVNGSGYFGQRCVVLDQFDLKDGILTIAYKKDDSKFWEEAFDRQTREWHKELRRDKRNEACPGYERSEQSRFAFRLNIQTWEEEPRAEPANDPVPVASATASLLPFTVAPPNPVEAGDAELAPAPLASDVSPQPNFQDEEAATAPAQSVQASAEPDRSPAPRVIATAVPSITYFKDCSHPYYRCNYHLEDEVLGVDEQDLTRFFPPAPGDRFWPRPNFDDGKIDYPQSPKGYPLGLKDCPTVNTCRFGINLYASDGTVVVLSGEVPNFFLDADISQDGRRVLSVSRSGVGTSAQVIDMGAGLAAESVQFSSLYQRANWLSQDRFALFSNGEHITSMEREETNDFPQARIVDAGCAKDGGCLSLASFSGMQPLGGGTGFLGVADLANCVERSERFLPAMVSSDCNNETPVTDRNGLAVEDSTGNFIYRPLDPEFPAKPFADHLSFMPSSAAGSREARRRVDIPGLRPDELITAIKVSPAGKQLVVAVRAPGEHWVSQEEREFGFTPDPAISLAQTVRILAFDIGDRGELDNPRELVSIDEAISESTAPLAGPLDRSSGISEMQFTPDGQRLIFTRNLDRTGASYLYSLASGAKEPSAFTTGEDGTPEGPQSDDARVFRFDSRRIVAAGNDRAFGLDNGTIIDLGTGKALKSGMAKGAMVRAGYIVKSKLLWAASSEGVIRFWDAEDGVALMTLFTYPGQRFFAVTPGGRYDTNMGPDSKLIRWRVSDAPWTTYAPQTFMRDFYEPGLYRKIVECHEREAKCINPFGTLLPSVVSLNRLLPDVRITGVEQGDNALEAKVTVEVRAVENKQAGMTSGRYNLRLFRNGRVVAMTPDAPDALPAANSGWRDIVTQWRGPNELPGNGVYRHTFTVPVPSGRRAGPQTFSAYAFNEDRIKSETAIAEPFVPTRGGTRPRRAYVISVGIGGYKLPVKSLHYSVNDARLMGRELASIPGYQTRILVVAGENTPGDRGTLQTISRDTLRELFSLITTGWKRGTILLDLRSKGIDASMIEPATPDDIVIFTFSGHGDTDSLGNFYLIPSDGTWARATDMTQVRLDTLVSAADLSNALRMNQAGEIALVLDACRSAASVAAGGFRPAPLGDAGLGQLAYDKGILILAAAQPQANAVADGRLRQGLLSFALAAKGEGLSGKADLDHDGIIRLDEWLRYPVQRMPELNFDRKHKIYDGETGTFKPTAGGQDATYVQQPTLFDFNAGASPVELRRGLARR